VSSDADAPIDRDLGSENAEKMQVAGIALAPCASWPRSDVRKQKM